MSLGCTFRLLSSALTNYHVWNPCESARDMKHNESLRTIGRSGGGGMGINLALKTDAQYICLHL